ncbi:unnamed protein product [Allacma fusca]|uniref:Hexosyltransferase n=1 Tax=Allacma fusca TaxID=39272 RepID=A0A8J2JPD0_9HEXA|nr:unnamed protein product [Allacma fusca]
MQSIFYHNSSGDQAFTGNLKRPEVHRGLTLHPVKDFRHMYRLHSYIQSLTIQELLFESLLVQRDLLGLENANDSYTNQIKFQNPKIVPPLSEFKELEDLHIHGLPPSLSKFQPQHEGEIINWSFLGKGIFSSENSNPKQKIDGSMKESLEDVVRDLMDIINGYSRARGRIIDFKEILYGYHRVNPLYGEDFVLDLLMTYKKYRGRKMTVPVRRHAYIQRPFAPLQLNIIMSYLESRNHLMDAKGKVKKLVLILPLSGRLIAFGRFLQDFKTSCSSWTSDMRNYEKFSLHLKIVYFDKNNMEDRNGFFSVINAFRETNPGLTSCQIQIVQMDGDFSRSIALETGISQCGENDLLFLIDVDISFTTQALERVLLNTVQGQRVYFPIVFSQFSLRFFEQNDDASEDTIHEDKGYWRDYGFGIAAFYKSDFRQAGGFDTSIQGWGKEDVSLYEKFISETNLTIFRAPDPQLFHVYHDITCDDQLSSQQYEMCLGTQANTLGSSKNLVRSIFLRRPVGRVKRFLEQSASGNIVGL